jgi:hypothetical protein
MRAKSTRYLTRFPFFASFIRRAYPRIFFRKHANRASGRTLPNFKMPENEERGMRLGSTIPTREHRIRQCYEKEANPRIGQDPAQEQTKNRGTYSTYYSLHAVKRAAWPYQKTGRVPRAIAFIIRAAASCMTQAGQSAIPQQEAKKEFKIITDRETERRTYVNEDIIHQLLFGPRKRETAMQNRTMPRREGRFDTSCDGAFVRHDASWMGVNKLDCYSRLAGVQKKNSKH